MNKSTVLILGVTSNVARESAILHAKAGDDLILTARNKTHLEPLEADLRLKYKVNVSLVELDAMALDGKENIVTDLAEKSQICYCYWGYLGTQEKAAQDWNESFKQIMANYTGCIYVLNIVANVYEKRKSGAIVGVSSVAGLRGRQSNYMYGSAKAGFTAYLSGLRNRLFKSGVHVMTVLPGFMRTKMTEGLPLPGPLTTDPDKAASIIYKGLLKKKNCIYVSWIWKYIMLIIRNIPEFIFKKLSM